MTAASEAVILLPPVLRSTCLSPALRNRFLACRTFLHIAVRNLNMFTFLICPLNLMKVKNAKICRIFGHCPHNICSHSTLRIGYSPQSVVVAQKPLVKSRFDFCVRLTKKFYARQCTRICYRYNVGHDVVDGTTNDTCTQTSFAVINTISNILTSDQSVRAMCVVHVNN